jgi:hypothetical protein
MPVIMTGPEFFKWMIVDHCGSRVVQRSTPRLLIHVTQREGKLLFVGLGFPGEQEDMLISLIWDTRSS